MNTGPLGRQRHTAIVKASRTNVVSILSRVLQHTNGIECNLSTSAKYSHPLFVLMYMKPVEVKTFFREIGEHAPEGSEILCDFISPLGIGQSPMAGPLQAESVAFRWGAHNGQEIASLHPRLELLEQHSVSEAYGWWGPWLEALWSPATGGLLYGLAHLKVSDD